MREQLELSQREVAAQLAVQRSLISRWENGDRPVASRYVPDLSRVFRMSEEQLAQFHSPALRGRPRKLGGLPRLPRRRRRPYKHGATLNQMLALDNCATNVQERARGQLGGVQYACFCAMFPRDTTYEFLVAHHAVAAGAGFASMSPRSVGCPLFIVRRRKERREYAGDAVQPALVWRSSDELLIMFGQVKLAVVSQSRDYRVDFLMLYRGPDRKSHWLHLEIDGAYHRETANADARRAVGLGTLEVRFENDATLREDFFHGRLLPAIRRRVEGSQFKP